MELELFFEYIGNCVKKINSDVNKLHENSYNDSELLDRLSSQIIMMENHIKYFSQINQINQLTQEHMAASQTTGEEDQTETEPEQATEPEPEPGEEPEPRYFTLEELAQYNGKDGNPAYVAVNGVVYDVTNNPLWAGGNHFFGITAGQDRTNDFETCHPGAMVLSVLPVVGYLTLE